MQELPLMNSGPNHPVPVIGERYRYYRTGETVTITGVSEIIKDTSPSESAMAILCRPDPIPYRLIFYTFDPPNNGKEWRKLRSFFEKVDSNTSKFTKIENL